MSLTNSPPGSAPQPEALPELGDWERPPFLRNFPQHPELDRLVRAFLVGNYAFIRKTAPALIRSDAPQEVRNAAVELRKRISPAPMVVALLVTSLALLVFLVAWTYWESGHVHG